MCAFAVLFRTTLKMQLSVEQMLVLCGLCKHSFQKVGNQFVFYGDSWLPSPYKSEKSPLGKNQWPKFRAMIQDKPIKFWRDKNHHLLDLFMLLLCFNSIISVSQDFRIICFLWTNLYHVKVKLQFYNHLGEWEIPFHKYKSNLHKYVLRCPYRL